MSSRLLVSALPSSLMRSMNKINAATNLLISTGQHEKYAILPLSLSVDVVQNPLYLFILDLGQFCLKHGRCPMKKIKKTEARKVPIIIWRFSRVARSCFHEYVTGMCKGGLLCWNFLVRGMSHRTSLNMSVYDHCDIRRVILFLLTWSDGSFGFHSRK